MRKVVLALLVLTVAVVVLLAASNPPTSSPTTAPHIASLPSEAQQAMATINPERIRAHVKFLASDLLEGRGTGQRGGDIAAEYIATEFALYGLKPAGDDGSYMQKVPMVGIATVDDGTTFELVPQHGAPLNLKNRIDYVAMDETGKTDTTIDAPIVWMGYGIDAPEYKWNDYDGVDVKGKILLMLVNEPPSEDPNFFTGKALTYYGRWAYKYEEAARMGAAGVILIHKTDMASYGWEVVRNSWGGERSYLRNDFAPKLKVASWIQLDVARKLAQDCGMNLDEMIAAAQKPGFKAEPLPAKLKAHIISKVRPFDSNNVVAMLPGSGANLKDQAVMYSAHYDHLGIVPGMPGDNIYNGAQDNATGVGILLEIARAYSIAKQASTALGLLCFRHRRGAGSARLRVLRQAPADSREGVFARPELRRRSPAWRAGTSAGLRSRTHDLLSHGGEDGEGIRIGDHSRSQSQCRPLLSLRSLQLCARRHSGLLHRRGRSVQGTRSGVGR